MNSHKLGYPMLIALALLSLSCAGNSAHEQSGDEKNNQITSTKMSTTTLNGIVLDANDHPLEEVIVTILSGPAEVNDIAPITNSEGLFSFDGLALGTYEIKFIYGEQSFTKTVDLKEADQRFTFRLE